MNCRSRWWFLGDLDLNIRSKGNTSFHVATSQRRDFATLRRRNVAMPGQQKQVNKQPNVSTSRRHHDFCTNIIKSMGRPNFRGIKERTDESTESRAAATRIIGEDSSFCISSFLQTKLLMISRLIMCILKSSMF